MGYDSSGHYFSRFTCTTGVLEQEPDDLRAVYGWFTIPCSGKTASFASNMEKESGGEADPLCSSIDVFDEQHVIPFFSIKQLIDQILGQQNPISARANPLRLAVLLMTQRIILRIVRSCIEIFR
jgi:hypothetical protein